MKLILTTVVCLTFVTASIHAASDADVTIIKRGCEQPNSEQK